MPPLAAGSTGTATVKQVSVAGAPSGQVDALATGGGAGTVVVVATVVDGAEEVGDAVVGATVVVVVAPGVDKMSATVVADGVEDPVPLELQPDMVSATVMPRQGGIVLQRMAAPIRS